MLVNDLHSQLNATRVAGIESPRHEDELVAIVARARHLGRPISIASGRHSMGGQQFGEGTTLVDMCSLDRVVEFDACRGLVTVEAGIQWPALMAMLARLQAGHPRQWGIYQKQTGADRLSLGGALACNAHGRGLTMKPIVDQVEAFDLVTASGDVLTCSRRLHPELFRLAIGGYGLFGVMVRVTLRLRPRIKVRRVVELVRTRDVVTRFDERIRDGFEYGDFQFRIDASRDSFLCEGIFPCYLPVPDDTAVTADPRCFSAGDWARLTLDAHTHKSRAFDFYAARYLETSGQIYWADEQLAGSYVDHYHEAVDHATNAKVKGTEMITEVFVPRPQLAAFMEAAARDLRQRDANVIYGTVRLIERDDETWLAWARDRYACVVFNLHVDHTPVAIASAADAFRALIDLAIEHGGSYYLTYHRWARQDQVERCYPQMREFLAAKRHYDPDEVFQSEWYRHYRWMLS